MDEEREVKSVKVWVNVGKGLDCFSYEADDWNYYTSPLGSMGRQVESVRFTKQGKIVADVMLHIIVAIEVVEPTQSIEKE